jgi:hypothetical protein
MARIDAPFLADLYITFFHQPILDTPQLVAQFISRTPNFKAHKSCFSMTPFRSYSNWVRSRCEPHAKRQIGNFRCGSGLHVPHSLGWNASHLYICEGEYPLSRWQDDVENDQWLEILHPFTTVKNLYLSKGVVPRIAPAL